MRYSLVISLLIHASILLAAVVVLPDPDGHKPQEEEPIAVDIVEFTDKTQTVAAKKDSQPIPDKPPLPPKVEKVAEPKPPAKPAEKIKKAEVKPQPEPAPEPEPEKVEPEAKPDPVEELIKKTETEPLPEPKPDVKPEAEAVAKNPVPVPRAKPKVPKQFKLAQKKKKKKHKFDPNKLTALLNKVDEERTSTPDPSEVDGTPANSKINDVLSGKDEKLTGSEAAWLRQKVQQCWSPPVGVAGAEKLVVRVQFELAQSGDVIGQPKVLNSVNHPTFDVASRAAVRAVLMCQPYDGLPVEKFKNWQNAIIRFDPRYFVNG